MFKISLIPREQKFFDFFEASARNSITIAKVFKELIDTWEDIEAKVHLIEDLEHEGDSITHKVIEQLHRTFVTPFDREDITLLAQSLDDVADCIHDATMAMFTYKVERPRQIDRDLADIILQAVIEVETAVCCLRRRDRLKDILKHCVEVNRLENAADKIFRKAMVELFDNSDDIATVIKWREIYNEMETATDRCEDVANVLEGIALKHA